MGEIGRGMKFVDRGDPSGLDFTKDTLTTDGDWHDLDLSSIIPPGTKAVLINCYVYDDAAGSSISIRKKGNTNSLNRGVIRTQAANVYANGQIIVFPDPDRKCSYSATNTTFTNLDLSIGGWWV